MKQTILVLITILVLAGIVFMVKKSRQQNKQVTIDITPTTANSQPTEQNSSKEQLTTDSTKEESLTVSEIALDVQLPVNNSTVSTSSILVRGKTAANAEVYVNEIELKADSSGNFSTTINLEDGENYIFISVNDGEGNFAEKEIIVNLEVVE